MTLRPIAPQVKRYCQLKELGCSRCRAEIGSASCQIKYHKADRFCGWYKPMDLIEIIRKRIKNHENNIKRFSSPHYMGQVGNIRNKGE